MFEPHPKNLCEQSVSLGFDDLRKLDTCESRSAFECGPVGALAPVQFRVRQDRVDTNGTVTLRYQSKLRHIAVGRIHKHQPVRLLVADDHVRVIREDGSLLRELTIDPGRDYQSLKVSSMY